MSSFWDLQDNDSKNTYTYLLQVIGSLSNLFSDSSSPYLYYRAHENLFCEVFEAKNLSRGDVSYDAIKNRMGIGLKTFLNQNGKTFQKVAEFNAESDSIRALSNIEDIVHRVADLRNKRLEVTQNMTNTTDTLYHLVTRSEGKMHIVETPMHKVDINSLKIPKKQNKNTIKFSDQYNEYSFSLSKNTLLKRFDTSPDQIIHQFSVDILENPFEILSTLPIDLAETSEKEEQNFIILPLYSPKDNEVSPKSGLNQWNAAGRKRHPNEVYIPVPAWIHTTFNDFFVYSRERTYKNQTGNDFPEFEVELPNGNTISCRISQQGGKALMSNPNKALGEWILREVLKIPEGDLVTLETLHEVGIDSVKVTKKNDSYYYLDFMETGSFEEFELNNKE